MTKLITGIHHVTALSSDGQRNVDFYSGILGLRLVKKTVNFDAPEIYHLYFGNEQGSPGTILTFFPYPGIPKGRKGKGQLTDIAFSVDANSLSYWETRLKQFNIPFDGPFQRFDETVLAFVDNDGLGLELVGTKQDQRTGFTYGHIPLEHSIKGFYGITLSEECDEKTVRLLVDQMDHVLVAKTENRFRYSTGNKPGEFVDVLCNPETLRGQAGYGTVHHVAFATATEASQVEIRTKLLQAGHNVTPVINREYFHSIYYREPGGVLFEVATLPPGFTIDEPLDHLGESLKLPPWEEKNREYIEKVLPPINFDKSKFVKR